MKTATAAFGRFDVCTIREVVEHIDEYDDGAEIYVRNDRPLEPWTPAAVTSEWMTGSEVQRELGFTLLGEVDVAREVIYRFDTSENVVVFRQLLDAIEEWCA